MSWHLELVVGTLVAGISACANLYYIVRHSNGKKSVRMITFVIMLYFFIVQLGVLAHLIPMYVSDSYYLRPWIPVLYVIPIFDIIVDFKPKSIPKPESPRGNRP